MHTLRLLFAFSILLGNHGWRLPLRHRRTGRLHRQSALPDDGDAPPSPSTVRLTAGPETLVSTLAENRQLSTVELEVTFSHLPALKALAQADASFAPLTPRAAVQRALAAVDATPTEEDVVKVLEIFRKTILGKEKYRIVNPGKVAATYNEVLRTCLAVPECFSAAANALDYAGLVLREHVIERPRTTDGGGGAVLDVASLWTTACIRLLDVDVGVGSTSSDDTPEGTKTWDQRFFSQVDMDLDGQASIQDMMLNVLRVAVRVLLAREADLAGPAAPGATGPMGTVDVAVDEYGGGGGAYFPPVSAAKFVARLGVQVTAGDRAGRRRRFRR